MKFLLLSIFLTFGVNQKEEIHLSYNVLRAEENSSKHKGEKGCISFYMNEQEFESCKKSEKINKGELSHIKLLDLNTFVKLAHEKEIKSYKKTEHLGYISVLDRNDIFDTVYLYEEKDECIYRYKVEWIEQIVD